jgi:hypothetical protein
MQRCGARKKQNGGTCENWAVRGRNRCRMHGGKTLVGAACPHFRSGRYSAYLPPRLRARYEQAADDPELLSLRSEVALVDARLTDLLSRVHTGESGQLWAELRRAYRAFAKARLAGDDEAAALATVERLIERAGQDDQAWAEIGARIEQRRKLAESESKRLVTLQQMMTAEQAMVLVRNMIDIITRHVSDRQVLTAIVVEMRALSEQPHGWPMYPEDPDT